MLVFECLLNECCFYLSLQHYFIWFASCNCFCFVRNVSHQLMLKQCAEPLLSPGMKLITGLCISSGFHKEYCTFPCWVSLKSVFFTDSVSSKKKKNLRLKISWWSFKTENIRASLISRCSEWHLMVQISHFVLYGLHFLML